MSSALFRQLASGGQAQRPDRLFRAAVSAFVSLTRPTRREIAQLDDLALPLYASIPVETKRYAAAILSECSAVPPTLLRKLVNEAPEISAPLLIRSPALSDVDLIGLIARHGSAHARVIGRRAGLNPAIASLIRVLSAQEGPAENGSTAKGSDVEENVRDRLRLIMRAANTQAPSSLDEPDLPAAHIADARLRTAALSNELQAFEQAPLRTAVDTH
ncbi:hypothetical protein AB2N04_15575 [Nitratireductor sp. GISD-1A_MAKvit]|uniref:hypothetical protein n=1 Tax=Nitratireductor sp. GISD-1A_MAKvit TaxID=3234198 RepID=UPI003466F7DF